MLYPLLSVITNSMVINNAIVDEISLGGAAFRSLLWTILFGVMLWVELRYEPREIPQRHWLRTPKFHYIVVGFVGLIFVVNLILTIVLLLAVFSV